MKLGLLRNNRPGGRWSEKLLTLTVPHSGLSSQRRVELLKESWPRFLRSLNLLWKQQKAFKQRAYYRVNEWTPGEDGLGHPHVHVWLWCPWIPQAVLVELWRRAIECSGYRFELGARPVVDIRAARGDDVSRELIKYMTKDLVGDGEHVEAGTYALVYQFYDGARRVQGSRGLMLGIPPRGVCPDCHEMAPYAVEFEKPRPGEDGQRDGVVVKLRPRGPPDGGQRNGETRV